MRELRAQAKVAYNANLEPAPKAQAQAQALTPTPQSQPQPHPPGGCWAVALDKLGLFMKEEEAVAALDAKTLEFRRGDYGPSFRDDQVASDSFLGKKGTTPPHPTARAAHTPPHRHPTARPASHEHHTSTTHRTAHAPEQHTHRTVCCETPGGLLLAPRPRGGADARDVPSPLGSRSARVTTPHRHRQGAGCACVMLHMWISTDYVLRNTVFEVHDVAWHQRAHHHAPQTQTPNRHPTARPASDTPHCTRRKVCRPFCAQARRGTPPQSRRSSSRTATARPFVSAKSLGWRPTAPCTCST